MLDSLLKSMGLDPAKIQQQVKLVVDTVQHIHGALSVIQQQNETIISLLNGSKNESPVVTPSEQYHQSVNQKGYADVE